MGKTRSKARKFFWFVIFVLGVGSTVFAVALVITEYFSYPVQTSVTLETTGKVG